MIKVFFINFNEEMLRNIQRKRRYSDNENVNGAKKKNYSCTAMLGHQKFITEPCLKNQKLQPATNKGTYPQLKKFMEFAIN